MRRLLVLASVLAIAGPAFGLRIAIQPPLQRAVHSQAVFVGTVTAVEKDAVEAAPFPNAPNKQSFKVAVVKIDTPLAGVTGMTHLKVGFVPTGAAPATRPAVAPVRGFGAPNLKAGDQFLFFLNKHPSAGFYQMTPMATPIDATTDDGKKEVADVKAAFAVIADPLKALKADAAEERYRAAAVLVSKYRARPQAPGQPTQDAIPAEESKRILNALAEADWGKFAPGVPAPQAVVSMLGLTPQDGWKHPQPKAGQDFNKVLKDAFAQWLAGPGKEYRIKKFGTNEK